MPFWDWLTLSLAEKKQLYPGHNIQAYKSISSIKNLMDEYLLHNDVKLINEGLSILEEVEKKIAAAGTAKEKLGDISILQPMHNDCIRSHQEMLDRLQDGAHCIRAQQDSVRVGCRCGQGDHSGAAAPTTSRGWCHWAHQPYLVHLAFG